MPVSVQCRPWVIPHSSAKLVAAPRAWDVSLSHLFRACGGSTPFSPLVCVCVCFLHRSSGRSRHLLLSLSGFWVAATWFLLLLLLLLFFFQVYTDTAFFRCVITILSCSLYIYTYIHIISRCLPPSLLLPPVSTPLVGSFSKVLQTPGSSPPGCGGGGESSSVIVLFRHTLWQFAAIVIHSFPGQSSLSLPTEKIRKCVKPFPVPPPHQSNPMQQSVQTSIIHGSFGPR